MAITQTVDIPANRRLTIQEPDYVGECPECAKHRDPETGELRFNAVTLAALQETSDIMSGKKMVK